MTHELPTRIEGKGEVSGIVFFQELASDKGYIYRAESAGETKENSVTHSHFEVFLRKESPVCLDFSKRIYSETEFRVVYPRANSFGRWAWSFPTLEAAKAKLESKNI